jgi:hypothetical protein
MSHGHHLFSPEYLVGRSDQTKVRLSDDRPTCLTLNVNDRLASTADPCGMGKPIRPGVCLLAG